MPTGKAPKHTRKLKQRQDRTNKRRAAHGKKPLPLNRFYGISRKRDRAEIEKRNEQREDVNNKHQSNSKRKDSNQARPPEPFGFGSEMDPNSAEAIAFAEEMADGGESGYDSEDIENNEETKYNENEIKIDEIDEIDEIDAITTTKRPSFDKLSKRNKKLTNDILKHQKALEALKEQDPAFYSHLKSVDDTILQFGDLELSEIGHNEQEIDENVNKIQYSRLSQFGNEFDENDSNFEEFPNDDNKNNNNNNNTAMDISELEPPFKKQRILPSDAILSENDEANAFLESESSDSEDNKNKTNGMNMEEEDEDYDIMNGIDGGSDVDFNDDSEGDYVDGDIIQETVEHSILEMSAEQLGNLIEKLENEKSVSALRSIMHGFCDFVETCIVSQETVDARKKANEKTKKNKSKRNKRANVSAQLTMASNPAFQDLLRYCLTKLAPFIPKILEIDAKQQNDIQALRKNSKVIKYFSSLRRYMKEIYVFLSSTTDEMMQRLLLIHLKQLSYIFLLLGEAIQRLFIKRVCHLWSAGSPTVRIDAFLFLYEIGRKMHSKPLLKLYKYMYQSFVTICKRVSESTLSGINFMMNGMVQMYQINPIAAYQESFHRLRAIAFHVKQGIQIMAKHQTKGSNDKEKEKYRNKKLKQSKDDIINSIYNWRFVNLIRLWSKVIGSQVSMSNSDLHLLIYPFVQIVCSVLTLSRSHALNPGRLKLIKSMIDLIESCQKCGVADRRVFVPIVPHLITMMNNPAFAKTKNSNPFNKNNHNSNNGNNNNNNNINDNSNNNNNNNNNKSTESQEENEKLLKKRAKRFDLRFKIKTPDSDFGTIEYHTALIDNIVSLMIRYFSSYSCELSFPELSFPVSIFLKEFLDNGNISSNLKVKARLLNKKLRENSDWIEAKRRNVTFSPKDFQQVHAFLHHERMEGLSPLSKFLKSKQYSALSHLPEAPKSKRKFGTKKQNTNKKNNDRNKYNNSKHKNQNKNASKSQNNKSKKKNKVKTKQQDNGKNEKTKKKNVRYENKNSGDLVEDLVLSD